MFNTGLGKFAKGNGRYISRFYFRNPWPAPARFPFETDTGVIAGKVRATNKVKVLRIANSFRANRTEPARASRGSDRSMAPERCKLRKRANK